MGTSRWGIAAAALLAASGARADDDTLARYRQMWNPFSAGPELVSSADLQPPGQFFARPYLFSEVAYGQFGDLALNAKALGQTLVALAPQVELSVGILNWLEFEMYVPETSWWQLPGGGAPAADGNGFGDVTGFLKWRFHLQQPDSWVPSLTEVVFVTLPTSTWAGPAGTPAIPGGFAPLGRLPATHFGVPELTESILFRKNFRPFRLSGGLYYSYSPPGSTAAGAPADFGDIFQYRLAFEQFLDDAKGFAYAIELVGLHGLPFRLDGAPVDAGRSSFGLLGIEPTVEYDFTDQIVAAAGVMVTAAGYNDVAAVYPNFSLYFYWNPRGHVIAR